ncbi:hypothetical protein B5X24_HaOG200273 [Helicoverpa armigera]|uniref:UDP-glucuronosyltransferase n=1 Tax=Helicoverpa armigera TaxID=29058 RepID=A0A2W1B9W6_HELAM|nr:hypothetical protein B5X24_HaOG200273 [Helicoverpa armigera]
MMYAQSFLIFTLLITFNDAAKILAMFPVPSISHQVAFRPLTQELARRGHEVTVITPNPTFPKGGAPANLTEIDVHDISYGIWRKLYEYTSGTTSPTTQTRIAFQMMVQLVEKQLQVDEVQRLIKEEKFDLLFLEAVAPALIVSHIFKAPVIQISSFGPMNFNVETIGAAWHPLLYPNSFSQKLYNMTKWNKLEELWNFYSLEDVVRESDVLEYEMAKRLFGENAPTVKELRDNVDMLFLNTHRMWEGNRPAPPSVVYMGGLHQMPPKELPKDLKTYLDSSKNGVIYVSFGTNIQPSLFPPERVQMFIKVFSELPYDFLWKYDKDELPGRTSNIRISKWLPQPDLLRHPNVKAFITQGGLQSTDEAISAGVPMVGLPIVADQWYNTEKYVHHKIGVKLDLDELSEQQLKNAIKTVVGNKSYRENIVKLGQLMYDQPMTPLERAVWWTEHLLRHGGARHLRSPAANISWTQYLELELVLTVLSVILGLVSVLLGIVYYLWKSFTSKSVSKKVKKN